MKKRLFRLFSFVLACVLLFLCFSVPAYAVDFNSARFNRFKALIASAIQAINIGLSASQATFSDLTNYIADPLELVYTYSEEASDQYWDQQTIHMYKDYVTIDGVPYTDIWLSHDIAEKMRVDAFDFKTGYNIASNSNGTFVSGSGLFGGVPVFETSPSQHLISQSYEISDFGSYSIGEWVVNVIDNNSEKRYQLTRNGSNITSVYNYKTQDSFPSTVYFDRSSNNVWTFHAVGGGASGYNASSSIGNAAQYFNNTPFDFNYVSETIPAEQTLPQDTGLMLRVPSSAVDQWMEDNPDETDVDWNIDIDSPDIMAKLDDLFDLIVPIIPIIEADFSEQHVAPVPPVPGETISNTDYSILDQTLQDIREDIQAIPSAIQEIVSSIPTKLDTIIQAIGNLGNTILQEIEEGPIRLARKAIDAIKSIFLPILVSLKNALGIWHYVVEWFNAISSPFTWFRGVMASSSPSLLVPVYAAVAGFIVIAVYRRFGR